MQYMSMKIRIHDLPSNDQRITRHAFNLKYDFNKSAGLYKAVDEGRIELGTDNKCLERDAFMLMVADKEIIVRKSSHIEDTETINDEEEEQLSKIEINQSYRGLKDYWAAVKTRQETDLNAQKTIEVEKVQEFMKNLAATIKSSEKKKAEIIINKILILLEENSVDVSKIVNIKHLINEIYINATIDTDEQIIEKYDKTFNTAQEEEDDLT